MVKNVKNVLVCPEGNDRLRFILTPSTSGSRSICPSCSKYVTGRGIWQMRLMMNTTMALVASDAAKTYAAPARQNSNASPAMMYSGNSASVV